MLKLHDLEATYLSKVLHPDYPNEDDEFCRYVITLNSNYRFDLSDSDVEIVPRPAPNFATYAAALAWCNAREEELAKNLPTDAPAGGGAG